MQMDLRQLTALVAVAEHGSFSAAARATHTVQSNVSTHVARLEAELRAPLVDRASGRLTEEGEAALHRARRVMAELEALRSDVAALRAEVVGSVRLGVIGSVGRWLVPEVVARMAEQHPGVDLVVLDASTTSLVPQMLDGALELAVVNLPLTEGELGTETLFDEQRVLVVPTGHPLAAERHVELAELARHDLILEPRGTSFRDEADASAARAGVALHGRTEVDGITLVASLAFRGYGPAIVPATVLFEQPPGAWTVVRVDDLQPRGVGLARRRDRRLAAPARAVRDVILEVVADLAPQMEGVELIGA